MHSLQTASTPKHGRWKGVQDFNNVNKKVDFLLSSGKNKFYFCLVGKRCAKSTNGYPLEKILLMPMKTVIGKPRGNLISDLTRRPIEYSQ